ncbi:hypothetical protein HGRIS_008910 [Hohenbuehelia grisea]|uniref:Uncharacterized protein n=1 Tax=Hohenbuehelia grisea TaxID=104357 RepID=A0ABR3J007_9AGAR
MLNIFLKASFFILGVLFLLAFSVEAFPLIPRDGSSTLVTLATFNASDAFLANQSIANGPLGALTLIEGGRSKIDTYYGIQIEDGKTGYVLAVFKGNHPTERAPNAVIKKLLAKLAKGDILVEHIKLNGDPTPVTAAPATEIISIDILPGHTLDDATALFNQLARRLNEITGKWGQPHWGPVIEDSTKVHFLLGWDSVEADNESLDDPELQEIFAQVLQIVSGFSRHADFTQH